MAGSDASSRPSYDPQTLLNAQPVMVTVIDPASYVVQFQNETGLKQLALLASEYDLPLWNFWAAVSDLPNRGLYTRSDRPLQGDIYLTDEALQIHRMTGLETLNVVWRAVTGE